MTMLLLLLPMTFLDLLTIRVVTIRLLFCSVSSKVATRAVIPDLIALVVGSSILLYIASTLIRVGAFGVLALLLPLLLLVLLLLQVLLQLLFVLMILLLILLFLLRLWLRPPLVLTLIGLRKERPSSSTSRS